jgi:hypothetical protein
MKAVLVQPDAHRSVLIIMLPSLVCDQLSVNILIKDLRAMYSSLTVGEQYSHICSEADYETLVLAERSALASARAVRAASYWQAQWSQYYTDQISSADLPVALPDSRWLKIKTVPKATEWVSLTADATARVRAFLDSVNAPPFAIFVATFGILLSRYTAKRRLPVWIRWPNRDRPEWQNVIGGFANSHIIGLDMTSASSQNAVIDRVQRLLADASEHQWYPLDCLWRQLGRRLDNGFRLEFASYDERTGQTDSRPASTPMMVYRSAGFRMSEAPFQLGAHISDSHFAFSASYSTAIFTRQASRRILATYEDILLSLVAGRFKGTTHCGPV